jgi:hypothetical protein
VSNFPFRSSPSTRDDGKTDAILSHKGEFKAKGLESNTPFAAIDLSEGEWYDYDDKAGEEVSIKDIKWEIRRA